MTTTHGASPRTALVAPVPVMRLSLSAGAPWGATTMVNLHLLYMVKQAAIQFNRWYGVDFTCDEPN